MSKGAFTGIAIAIPILLLLIWLGSYIYLRSGAYVEVTGTRSSVRYFQLPDAIDRSEYRKTAVIAIYAPLARLDQAATGTYVVYDGVPFACIW